MSDSFIFPHSVVREIGSLVGRASATESTGATFVDPKVTRSSLS